MGRWKRWWANGRPLLVLRGAPFFAMAALAASCSGDSHGQNGAGTGGTGPTPNNGDYRETFCTAIMNRYVACGTIDASMRDQNIAECRGTPNASPTMRGDFLGPFAACIAALACEDLDGADDVCWPSALKQLNQKVLQPGVVDECAGGSSETCANLVGSQVTGSDVASACLRKWQTCTTASGFTEDDCLSLLAFTEPSRDAAAACLGLDCMAAGACLRSHGTINW